MEGWTGSAAVGIVVEVLDVSLAESLDTLGNEFVMRGGFVSATGCKDEGLEESEEFPGRDGRKFRIRGWSGWGKRSALEEGEGIQVKFCGDGLECVGNTIPEGAAERSGLDGEIVEKGNGIRPGVSGGGGENSDCYSGIILRGSRMAAMMTIVVGREASAIDEEWDGSTMRAVE